MTSDKEKQAKKKRQEELDAAEAKARAVAGQLLPVGSSAPALDDEKDDAALQAVMLKNAGIDNSDWKLMVEDYNAQYPDTPCNDSNRVMSFPNAEAAQDFLNEQAQKEPPRKFFATWVDANMQPTGKYSFSCGNGKAYTGQLNEIQQQLEAAQSANPDDANVKAGLAQINSLIAQKAQASNAEKQKHFKSEVKGQQTPEASTPEAAPSALPTSPRP